MIHVKVIGTKRMGKRVNYSDMVGKVFKLFKETKTTYVLYSNENYSFVTTVSKSDCKVTTEETIKYKWI